LKGGRGASINARSYAKKAKLYTIREKAKL